MVGILIFRFVHSRAMLVERVAGFSFAKLLRCCGLHQIKVAQGIALTATL